MKILVFGNIGSGKSTLSRVISEKLNEFELVEIDDFRKRYGTELWKPNKSRNGISTTPSFQKKIRLLRLWVPGYRRSPV